MLKKAHFMLLLFAILVLSVVAFAILSSTPEKKSKQFVEQHANSFSALLDSGQSIPSTWDGQTVDVWTGDHVMYEFTLGSGMGDRQYWGVYYSPDDVPLSFQNTDVPLSTHGDGIWTWHTEGDNHGTTKKITDKWYYFEASF